MNEKRKENTAPVYERVRCDHMIGKFWTDHVGNGTFLESEKLELEDARKHYCGFEFMPFNYCPKCGEKLNT